jgi:LysM repeat protein
MRVTVLTILALHVVFIGGLLMQGCDKKSGSPSTQTPSTASSLPSLGDTNYFSNFPGDAPGSTAGASGAGAATGGTGQGTTVIPPVDAMAGGASTTTTTSTPGGGLSAGSSLGDSSPSTTRPSTSGLGSGSLPVATTPTEPPPGAPGVTEHVIKQGDKIGDLAKVYNVTAQAIIDANPNAKPRALKVGDRLLIPPPVAASASAGATAGAAPTPTDGEVYVVKAGDNLSKIAKKFGVSVKALRTANNMRSDRILPKQRLTIPAKTASSSTN